jgi:type II secretion system protein N
MIPQSSETILSSPSPDAAPSPDSKKKKILRVLLWFLVGFFFLVLFTFIKLPNDRIQNWLDGNLAILLADNGVSYSAEKKSLSFFPSTRYHLEEVTLRLPNRRTSHLDELSVSPSILPLILGRYGGQAEIRDKKQTFQMKASVQPEFKTEKGTGRTPPSSPTGLVGSFEFHSDKFDFGKTRLLETLAGLQISSAVFDGHGKMAGNFLTPNTLQGMVSVVMSSLVLEPQNIQGFNFPKLTLSEGQIDLEVQKGKVLIKSLKLGKGGGQADDLQGTVQGDIALQQDWLSSILNLKINFSVSENVMKSFSLLEMLLAAYKQPDGSFSIVLTGPIYAPVPAPISKT